MRFAVAIMLALAGASNLAAQPALLDGWQTHTGVDSSGVQVNYSAGENRMLLVFSAHDSDFGRYADPSVVAPTFGAAELTMIDAFGPSTASISPPGNIAGIAAWYLLEDDLPASGSTLFLDYDDNNTHHVWAYAVYENVDQDDPIGQSGQEGTDESLTLTGTLSNFGPGSIAAAMVLGLGDSSFTWSNEWAEQVDEVSPADLVTASVATKDSSYTNPSATIADASDYLLMLPLVINGIETPEPPAAGIPSSIRMTIRASLDGTINSNWPAGNKIGSEIIWDLSTLPSMTGLSTAGPQYAVDLTECCLSGADAPQSSLSIVTTSGDDATSHGWSIVANEVLVHDGATTGAGSMRFRATVGSENVDSLSRNWSVFAPAGSDATPPTIPTGLRAEGAAEDEVRLFWDPSGDPLVDGEASGMARYDVLYSDGGSFSVIDTVVVGPGLSPAYSVSVIGGTDGSPDQTQTGASWEITHAGSGIDGTSDQFGLVSTQVSGDAMATARIAGVTTMAEFAKGGIMARASTAAGARYVACHYQSNGRHKLRRRTSTDAAAEDVVNIGAGESNISYKLERSGNTFTCYYSEGSAAGWQQVGSTSVTMPASIEWGLFVTGNNGTSTDATFEFENFHVTDDPSSVMYVHSTTQTGSYRVRAVDGSDNASAESAAVQGQPSAPIGEAKKWNPGHYAISSGDFSMSDQDEWRDMVLTRLNDFSTDSDEIKGVLFHMAWGALEPTKGNYDFSQLQTILDQAEALGKHVIVNVAWKNFRSDQGVTVPADFSSSEVTTYSNGSGHIAAIWNEPVMDQYIALHEALSAAFDSHPALEIVSTSETAHSSPDGAGFSVGDYETQLNRLALAMPGIYKNTITTMAISFGVNDPEAMIDNIVAAGGGEEYVDLFHQSNFPSHMTHTVDEHCEAAPVIGNVTGDVLGGKEGDQFNNSVLSVINNGILPSCSSHVGWATWADSYSPAYSWSNIVSTIEAASPDYRVFDCPYDSCITDGVPGGGGPAGPMKWNPGHYMAVLRSSAWNDPSTRASLYNNAVDFKDNPNIKGVLVNFYWSALEGDTRGDYTAGMQAIASEIQVLQALPHPKQLWIAFNDQPYNVDAEDIDEYFPQYYIDMGCAPITNRGARSALWRPQCVEPLVDLIVAYGEAFDSNPAVEGFNLIRETAMGGAQSSQQDFSWSALNAGYTQLLDGVKDAWPTTALRLPASYHAQNYPHLIQELARTGIGGGGPDTSAASNFPFSEYLAGHIGGVDYRGCVGSFSAVEVSELGLDTVGPPGGYTAEEIMDEANDELHASHIFWDHNNFAGTSAQRWNPGILNVINNRPVTHTQIPQSFVNPGSCP